MSDQITYSREHPLRDDCAYHTAAMRSLIGTDLIATAPRSIAELEASNPSVRIVKAPAVLGTFK